MFILILLFPVIFTIVWSQICLHSHDPLSEEFSVFPVVQVCLSPIRRPVQGFFVPLQVTLLWALSFYLWFPGVLLCWD